MKKFGVTLKAYSERIVVGCKRSYVSVIRRISLPSGTGERTVVRYGKKDTVNSLVKCLLYGINKGGTAENCTSFVL